MNIKFNKINIQNFLSIGEASIDFSNNGYILVKGYNNNKDDLATSNGSGKSSLFEAICWCLTGETIRGIKSDISNINTDDGAYVELDLEVSGDAWKIIRTKDHRLYKTNLKLIKNDQDISGKGIRDSSKILNEYLPDLTSSLIGSVIILGQGLPQRFSNNTQSGRKDVLEKLSKSDFMIEDLKDRIVRRKSFLSKELRKYEDFVLEYESKLSVFKDKLEQQTNELNTLKDKKSLENEISNLIESKESLEKRIEELKNKVDCYNKNIQDLRIKYSTLSKKKSEISLKINNDKLKEISKEDRWKSKELEDLNKKLAYTESTINSIKKEIKKIESIKDICPTCGQRIVGVIKPSTEQLENDLNYNIKNFDNINSNINNIINIYNININNINTNYSRKLKDSLFRTEEELTAITNNGNSLKSSINSLEKEIKQLSEELEKITEKIFTLKIELNSLENTKNSLINSINCIKNDIKKINEKIMYNKKEKELFESKIDIINKFNTVISRDFRGYLLNSVINFINKKAKEYSQCIFDTDKVNFSINGNNIEISYCNKQYENLSGGERQKVDLIIQFSIRDMLCKFLNFSCNILIVDEIFDNLDSIGCQKVVNLISTKLQDINNIYVVTHRGDLEIPYDAEIVVEKDEKGISRIV